MRNPIRSSLKKDSAAPFADFARYRRRDGEEATRTRDRAIFVAVILPHSTVDMENPLAELAALADAANVEGVGTMVQKRMSLDTSWALGKGKIEELAERVEATQADVVIFDNDLSPRQILALEKGIERRVIDRSELILDIFAKRATTREAQLQVELAQLEYTAPRLRGMWTHLERIAGSGGGTGAGAVGGVGTRGPGERQIEIDRRLVRDRIALLKKQIDEIDRRKQQEVRSRGKMFTISLVGYTNSGKSTLMNRLTGADRFAANMLFSTLDTKTVRWDLGDGRVALLSDTVGFVRDLPHQLVASFRATLEEAIHADLLLHVVDASAKSVRHQIASVHEVLASLGCYDRPRFTVLNKMDCDVDTATIELITKQEPHVMPISATTGQGIPELLRAVVEVVREQTVEVILTVPHAQSRLVAELDEHVSVLNRTFGNDAVELLIRVTPEQLDQIRGRYGQQIQIKE